MITALPNFFDQDEYYERLRIINKIICSYSREKEFSEAAEVVEAAKNYTVVAQPWVSHNVVYLIDGEGVMTKFILIEESND